MSVEFELKASVSDVFDWITDPDFIVQRALDLGELEMSCEVADEDEGVRVLSTRVTEVELPAFLARLFDDQQEVCEDELWTGDDDEMTADVTLDMTGKPVVIAATRKITAKGKNRCVWRVVHKARVSIPLIGGKAAKFVEQTADEKAQKELQYLADTLAAQ